MRPSTFAEGDDRLLALMKLKQAILKPVAHAIWNRGPAGLSSYLRVVKEFLAYRKASAHEDVSWHNFFPWPIDRYQSAGDAGMYFYQDMWCAERLKACDPPRHVDVGSSMMFVAMALQRCKLTYVDVRPIAITHPGFTYKHGDLTALPFESGSIQSISSLSVVEHVGLGRYGDQLDPDGTNKACVELARVLGAGGNLYVAVPTEKKSSTHFNAHRIFSPDAFIAKFPGLHPVEQCYALANGVIRRRDYDDLGQPYAFGCFAFTKAA